jgi:hypothetical protein
MTAPPASAPTDAPRVQTVIDAFDAAQRANAQRAAAEGRLEPVTDYTFAELLPRASLVSVAGGVMGFVTFLVAVPLVVTNYLARTHQAQFQLQGFALAALIVVNLVLGYGMLFAHEGLHAALCRLLGGTPTLTPTADMPARVVWSAGAQGFSRASYVTVLLGPLVIVAVLWLIILAALPALAAFLVVPVTVNAVMAGADLWSVVAALRQPASAVVFQDHHPGFVAYAIAAPKPAPPKPLTRPTGAKPAATAKPPAKKPTSAKQTKKTSR